jgi:hypothetical protein
MLIMSKYNTLNMLAKIFSLVYLVFVANAASAEDLLGYLTDKEGKYIGPSVEDNIAAMDKDKNGFADVYEVRAFLELKHGKGYQKELLDKWESSASGKSCSTPFAKDMYTDQTINAK